MATPWIDNHDVYTDEVLSLGVQIVDTCFFWLEIVDLTFCGQSSTHRLRQSQSGKKACDQILAIFISSNHCAAGSSQHRAYFRTPHVRVIWKISGQHRVEVLIFVEHTCRFHGYRSKRKFFTAAPRMKPRSQTETSSPSG